MSVYRPKYKDQAGNVVESRIWWYHFTFAGRHVQESSKSSRKTIAHEAEKKRRLEMERAFGRIEDRTVRIRAIAELVDNYLESYGLLHPRSSTFAKYAVGHIRRLLGRAMTVDVSAEFIKGYQVSRLKEKASNKSINEEVGFLLRILGPQGDLVRAELRRQKRLKLAVRAGIARAFTADEKERLLAEAKKRRSPSIYPALMLALHTGLRDAEIRSLQWRRLDLHRAIVTVAESKTEAGQGRTVPLNRDVLGALIEHAKWFLGKFKTMEEDWYVFPAGQPQPTDPTKPPTSFKTVWARIKKDAGITGRWHDNRHTFITDLAESGEASDETIRDIAGHVSKQMLKHYSHIRMEAKRRAVSALAKMKPSVSPPPAD